MNGVVGANLDARLDLLSDRVEATLDRARARNPMVGLIAGPIAGPVAEPTGGLSSAELEALTAKLQAAESSARLQAQRSQSLEEQVGELQAQLAAAQQRQLEAEIVAEGAQAQAAHSLAQLGDSHRSASEAQGNSGEAQLTQALQTKLLEIERLTSELTGLRRSNDEWRTRARGFRRELDAITAKHDKAAATLRELEPREAQANKRVAELERLVAEQARELEFAERRAKHLREHMGVRST